MSNPFQGILDCQNEAFHADRSKPKAWRLDQLDRMERMSLDNRDRWTDALYKNFGKPPCEQEFEITVPSGNIAYYRDCLDALMALEVTEIPDGVAKTGHKDVIHRDPYGVTLVIGPFGAPFLLLLDPALAALAAGNPVILTPANTTPETAKLFAELVPQYFDPRDVTVVTRGREEISALLQLPFDFIFFTGSSKVGKVVMRAAAEHLTLVILELGGQNPTLVDASADLDRAAASIAWSHSAISGQWCIAPGYVCVHEEMADAFVEKLKAAIRRMYGDDPSQNPDCARMTSEGDAARVVSYIVEDQLAPGGRYSVEDRYVEPTVLYPARWGDPAMQQEIFDPVLPILRFRDLGEVIDRIKAMEKPLAAYVFSRDQAVVDCFTRSVSFGGGYVNMTNLHCWVGSLPFGGVGASGMGKYYGRAGFEALRNTKSMLVPPADQVVDAFPPYANKDVAAMLKPFA